MSSSSFTSKTSLFFVVETIKAKAKQKDSFVPILDIIDAFDKTIISSQIGHSSKSKDFIKAVYNGISYRKADPKNS